MGKVVNSTVFLVTLVLVVVGIAHGLNMFRFPYYEADEGTYMSQAWAVTDLGKLSPYTYVYDHAPGGWLLLALWTELTGGFFTFGFSINSGRVLMLLLHLTSTLFLFVITNKLSKSTLIAAVSALIFSLSPLGIYFQRRVLLDNIMVFWLLGSLAVLVYQVDHLFNLFLSGLLLGVAVVTKENALVFIPAFWYLIFTGSPNRRFSSAAVWSLALMLPILPYLFYALSRGELFPYGSPFGGTSLHVSLIGTWLEQASRSSGSILDFSSPFWLVLRGWFRSDPFIVIFGILATGLNAVWGIKSLPNRIAAVFALPFILFLFGGGLLLEFYFLPLLPFIALNMAVFLWKLASLLNKDFFKTPLATQSSMIFVGLIIFNLIFFGSRSKNYYNLFLSDQTSPQISAVNWILSQKLPQATYVIDNYGYVDLHAKQNNNFKYAEYYWKVDFDADVFGSKLNNEWQNINFIASTVQMERDLAANPDFELTQNALKHAKVIKEFSKDGWGVKIWRVNPPDE